MDGCSASDVDATERFVFFQLHLSRSFFTLSWPVRRRKSAFKKLFANKQPAQESEEQPYLPAPIHP